MVAWNPISFNINIVYISSHIIHCYVAAISGDSKFGVFFMH